ncbi:MAG: tRNA 2-thiocytidine biosynthesis protein TtcA, partial [Lachnospiraceae bacterium]|nr:tRNA 2-thiocytidine biosynthesis protein TtcA [Lachnospiraceae bacterium]
ETTSRDNAETTSRRRETKELIRQLKKTNPEIETSIFNACHAVQLDTFPGYKTRGELHSFTENYEDFG